MASIEPYAPCPCGSGQKFKWCCHKVEPIVDKSERFLEGNQIESALSTLDEGLKKTPGNAWLLLRKAVILTEIGRGDEAIPALRSLLDTQPGNLGAWLLMTRLVLEYEGAQSGVTLLQEALERADAERRQVLALAAHLVGVALADARHYPAARAHLELSGRLHGEADGPTPAEQVVASIDVDLSASPWVRQPYQLAAVPPDAHGSGWERFGKALELTERGQWSKAAEEFEQMEVGGPPETSRNAALCRLWTLDHEGANAALKRFVKAEGETTEAVDFEALRQLMTVEGEADEVEHVHLIWTLRDREGLLAALRGSDRAEAEGPAEVESGGPEPFEVESFQVLDRPKPSGGLPEGVSDLPRVVARALVGKEIAILDVLDDGRLDGVTSWFTGLAGPSLPPAQPRTKLIERVDRNASGLRTELWMPEDTPAERSRALLSQERKRITEVVWAETPSPFLGGKSPLQAAQEGAHRVALRAAVCRLEGTPTADTDEVDFDGLREKLGIPAEPEIAAEGLEIDRVHIGRLQLVVAEGLDDDRLVELYRRARRYANRAAIGRTARLLAERPSALDREERMRLSVFGDLANLALDREDPAEALRLLDRGRQSDPASRTNRAPDWDILHVSLRARSEAPEEWVPDLAAVLERYRSSPEATSTILRGLMELGLVRVVADPNDPERLLLDTRVLQGVLAEYGPRITTAAGTLGVSASRGGIWTPDSPAGGSTTSGGIWTPEGAATSGEEKPKLFIPGR